MKKGHEVIGKTFGLTRIFRGIGSILDQVTDRAGKTANPRVVVSLLLTAVLALAILLPGTLPGQAGIVSASSQVELMTNGGFESGSTGWSIYGDFYADSRFAYPHSGTGYAYLSNADGTYGNNLLGSMEQAVTIPSSATSAMFAFWYSVTTYETGSTAWDTCHIIVFDSDYDLLAVAAVIDNTDALWPVSYSKVSLDLTNYVGQTIRIVVEAGTDASYPTVFRLDDFSILATVNQLPTAYIDSIAPNPATQGTHTVSFAGHGNDPDGYINGYSWRSSKDGQLSTSSSFNMPASALSAGTHTIYFKVKDNDGIWSPEVTRTLTINAAPSPNQPPTAYDPYISPNPATQGIDNVQFVGDGTNPDGVVIGYNWRSSKDGQLSTAPSFGKLASELSLGTHTIYFKVMDDDGAWSPEVTRTLTINPGPTAGPVTVATYSAISIGQTQATLRGAITSFNGNPSAYIRFWYRPSGGSWTHTSWVNRASTSIYSEPVSDLDPGTNYEFYAEGYGSVDTTQKTGATLGFQTEQPSQQPPLPPTNPQPGSHTSPGTVLNSNTVTLQWDESSGATRYALGVVNCNTLTFEVNTWVYDTSYPVTLQSDTPYRWNVAAWNDAGYSDYTSLLYFQTPPAGQPDLRIAGALEFPSVPTPFQPNVIKIRALVENIGSTVADNVEVSFAVDGVPIGGSPKNIGSIEPGSDPKPAEILWTATSNIENAALKVEAHSIDQEDGNPANDTATQSFGFHFVPFRHDRDAFSFENWYYSSFDEFNEEYVAFLEAALGDEPSFGGMIRFLAGITVGHFLEYFEGADGHCYGMALSSALWKIHPSKKPVQKQTFDMSFDEAKAEIMWNHWGQLIYIIAEGFWEPAQFDPQEEYNEILNSIKDSKPCVLDMVISITNRHSVTAYKILDLGTEKRVYIYDNNFPLSSKEDDYYITFNPGSATYVDPDGTTYWMTFAIPMFGVSAETLTIMKDTLKLFLKEIMSQLQNAGNMLFRTRSPVSTLLTDQNGHRIGYVGDTFVNEIPGAEMQEQLGSCCFYLPKDLIYSIQMTGTGTGTLGLDVVVPLGNSEARVAFWEDIPITLGSSITMALNAIDTDYGVNLGTGEIVQPDSISEVNVEQITPPSIGCFIATAAYGTPMAHEVQTLRDFRDQYLLDNPLGQAFVNLYYRLSPPIAEFITAHPSLKAIVRAGLVPIVAVSAVVVTTTVAEKIALVVLLVLIAVAVAVWATRQRGQRPGHT